MILVCNRVTTFLEGRLGGVGGKGEEGAVDEGVRGGVGKVEEAEADARCDGGRRRGGWGLKCR